MKNKVILIFLLFFIFPYFVAANENDQRIIYGVEKFHIAGDNITIGGYSFISHLDNYGVKDGKGNLRTYIVAYTGDWQEIYKDYNKCNSSSTCYSWKTSTEARDFWGSRCATNGCLYEEKIRKSVEAGNYNTSNCNTSTYKRFDEFENKFDPEDSSCLYYNVGFKVTINLNELFKKMSNVYNETETLNFKIVSSINSSGYSKAWSESLGVYNGVCTYGDGKKCSDNGEIVTNNYKFNIGGLSEEVIYDATKAYAKLSDTQDSQAEIGSGNGKIKVFIPGVKYKILEVKPTTTIIYGPKPNRDVNGDRRIDMNDGVMHPINGMFFRLAACWNGKNYKYDGVGTIFPCDKAGSHPYDHNYWTISDRIQVVGKLKINNLVQNVIEKKCSDFFPGETIDENIVNCGNNGSYNQCKGIDITSYIYYPSIECNNSIKCPIIKDGVRYAKVEVKTKVLFDQEGTFNFGKVAPTTVRAGKGFNLGETKYNNKIIWAIAYLKYDGTPYYNYGKSYGKLSDGSFGNIDINTSDNEMVYYENSNGDYIKTNLSNASFEAINVSVSKKIAKDKITDDNVIRLVSCDSNDSNGCNNSNPNYEVKGNWNLISSNVSDYNYNGKRFGRVITNNYKYQLADSYVVVTGDEAGLVKYKDEVASIIEKEKATGKKFYIDFKWNYNKNYPFNLAKDINPSLLNIMDWKLNGVCNIEVEQGYYRVGEGDGDGDPELNIRYRSINVNDPFPKKNIPVNWLEWYNKISNENRLKLTYHNLDDPLYHITLSKFESNDNKVQISEINKIKRHYLSFDNLGVNGRSTFVDTYFYKKAVAGKSYCPLGIFDSSCDDWGD